MQKKNYVVSAPDYSHFPTREQLFVFRNWDSVPLKKLAKILSATEEQVNEMASDLGLIIPQALNKEYEIRGKVTIIRNNWHILPYDQLQSLLDWDWETLNFELKENDFLNVKLGAKPEVPPVQYRPLTEEEKRKTEKIKAQMEELKIRDTDQREFDFVKQFALPYKKPAAECKEIVLDSSWCIVDQTKKEITKDYIHFFEKRLCDQYQISLGKDTKKTITLQIDPLISQVRESRKVIIEKSEIRILACDAVGILRGLVDLLHFMEKNASPSLEEGTHQFIPQMQERIVSPYTLLFADPLTEDSSISCPDALLEEYALLGINGIWLHSVLYKLTEFPFQPEISDKWQLRLENLQILAQRAEKYGVKVYLYFNEPRTMPYEFFEKYPDLLGRKATNQGHLCTQNAKVQEYLRNAVQTICKKVPQLGGFFSITRSENHTNCYSHCTTTTCPVCSKLSMERVISDLLVLLADSAKAINPEIDVIAWTWGWNERIYDHEYMADRFARHKIKLMATSEECCERTYENYTTHVIDYSISIPGPGDYARNLWDIYRKHGVEIMAKTQMNETWECACVPYYPVWGLIKQHYDGLCDSKVGGLFLSWSLGGYPGGMLRLLSRYMQGDPDAPSQLSMDFGPYAPAVESALNGFSQAFTNFPFSIGTAYCGPQQMGPANVLFEKDSFLSATMTCYPFDDLYHWKGGTTGFPLSTYVNQMQKLSEQWKQTLVRLKLQLPEGAEQEYTRLKEFLTISEALCTVYESCYGQCIYNIARDRYHALPDGEEKEYEREAICSVLKKEHDLSVALLHLLRENSTLGFEGANQYFFNQLSLMERAINCNELLDRFQLK